MIAAQEAWVLPVMICSMICSLILLILCISLIVKKKNKRIKVDETFISSLVSALGGKRNILAVKNINGRVNFELEDAEQANLETLKQLSTAGVFITNQTIKLLFSYDSDLICQSIQARTKGE